MTGIDTRAVLFGALVDNLGTFIVGPLFGLAVAQVSGAQSDEDLRLVIEGSAALLLVQMALGLAMTGLGAYTAATLAKGNERANAFAVGVVAVFVSFTLTFLAPESAPFWVEAAGLLLLIPVAFLGGEARLAVARMGRTK